MTLASSRDRRPPGPDAPVRLGIDPQTLETLEAARREYGDIVAFRGAGGRCAYFINDPAEIRRILVRQHERYRKGPGFERVKMLLGNGLIVSDGDAWRRSRTMIQPAFSRANVHRLIGLMKRCTLERERRWTEIAQEGGTINVTQETSDFALELILRAIFGPDYETHIVSGGDNPFAFLSQDPTRDLRVVLQLRELRELLLRIVDGRRGSEVNDGYDFLSVYMSARDKNGQAFTDEELLDELMNLIVAGYETSAGTLNWAWYLLAGNPDVHARLAREGAGKVPTADAVDEESLSQLPYTLAVLEETLRLYPPVWLFTRRAEADDALSGYDLPAGTDVYLSPYVLHRTGEYWREPDRFDPGRFGPDSGMKKGERPYFPFSLGPRRCLGEYFSFLEMKTHLGLLAQRFVMSRTGEPPGLDLGINLRTRRDIHLQPALTAPA
ncbi:MAG TPA: cytochrome P450 [Woeseiaceae bacterium]|nr:cytochrome P450 [Woeseiaceae bacterium]